MDSDKKAPSNAALERAREIIFDTLDEDYDTAYVNGPLRVARALDEWAAAAKVEAVKEVAKLLDKHVGLSFLEKEIK